MAMLKAKAVRVELAICLLAPIVALAVIAIPGYGHIRQLKRDVTSQARLLDEIPLQRQGVEAATKALGPYRMRNGGKDKSGELSLQVSQAASREGITIKSVNADKVIPAPSPACVEYRIAMAGEGTLGPVIRVLDELDRPVQCLKVVSFRLRAKAFIPQTLYDVDTVFVSDSLLSTDVAASPLQGGLEARLGRVHEGVLAVEAKGKVRKPVLDTRKIDRRKLEIKEEVAPVLVDAPVGFRLNGVIRDGQKPLALTDRGVFGVGDSIDGYRIIKVADDHIVVMGRLGQQEKVPLYSTEAKP